MNDLSRDRMLALITSYCISQAVACAANLRIADHLADQPRGTEELARLTGTSGPHLERLMRALCSAGVFEESADGFHLTALSAYLRKNSAGSVWPLAVLHGNEMYGAFSKLLENVRTGEPAWDIVNGLPFWEYLEKHPDRGAVFDDAMLATHESQLDKVVAAYDFSQARVIVDIGGGDGALLRRVLTQHASASGILQDAPGVIARARDSKVWATLAARCRFVGESFFEHVPSGGDVYLMKRVLHDWDDEHCVRLLKRCREAMSGRSRLVLIETVRGMNHARWVSGSDLGVMIVGGKERTLVEYKQLLAAAGLALLEALTPVTRLSLLEAGVA